MLDFVEDCGVDVKTSKGHVKHYLAGQNTQQKKKHIVNKIIFDIFPCYLGDIFEWSLLFVRYETKV